MSGRKQPLGRCPESPAEARAGPEVSVALPPKGDSCVQERHPWARAGRRRHQALVDQIDWPDDALLPRDQSRGLPHVGAARRRGRVACGSTDANPVVSWYLRARESSYEAKTHLRRKQVCAACRVAGGSFTPRLPRIPA